MNRLFVASVIATLVCAAAAWAQSSEPASAPAAPASSSASIPALTLDEVIAAATSNGPDIQVAKQNLAAARAGFLQAGAKNGFALGATGGYTHSADAPWNTSSTIPGITTAPLGETFQSQLALTGPSTHATLTAGHVLEEQPTSDQISSLDLAASQTLWDGYLGGRAAGSFQQAALNWQGAELTYDSALKSTLFGVKQAYYTLLLDQHTQLVRQATLTQSEQDLARTQALFDVQRATKLDVLQSQIGVTQARLDLRSAQNTLASDRRKLSELAGYPLDRVYSVAESQEPALPSLDLTQALKTAYDNRPELRQLALNVKSGNVAVALAKSQASPVVSLNGDVNMKYDWNSNISTGTWNAGVSVSLPILDSGLVSSQVAQAEAQLGALKTQLAQQQQNISIAVQGALFSVTDTKDRLALAQQNVQAAQGQYELTKAQLAVGLATNLDVLTASSALSSAEVGLEQAKNAYILAVLGLQNALGM